MVNEKNTLDWDSDTSSPTSFLGMPSPEQSKPSAAEATVAAEAKGDAKPEGTAVNTPPADKAAEEAAPKGDGARPKKSRAGAKHRKGSRVQDYQCELCWRWVRNDPVSQEQHESSFYCLKNKYEHQDGMSANEAWLRAAEDCRRMEEQAQQRRQAARAASQRPPEPRLPPRNRLTNREGWVFFGNSPCRRSESREGGKRVLPPSPSGSPTRSPRRSRCRDRRCSRSPVRHGRRGRDSPLVRKRVAVRKRSASRVSPSRKRLRARSAGRARASRPSPAKPPAKPAGKKTPARDKDDDLARKPKETLERKQEACQAKPPSQTGSSYYSTSRSSSEEESQPKRMPPLDADRQPSKPLRPKAAAKASPASSAAQPAPASHAAQPPAPVSYFEVQQQLFTGLMCAAMEKSAEELRKATRPM